MDKEKVVVRIMMQVINYASNEITKLDEDYKNKLQGLNEIIQWKIGDDISYYTEIKDGKVRGTFGTAPKPSFTIEYKDAGVALSLFKGEIDLSDLGKLKDKIKLIGDAKKVQDLSFIMLTAQKYMGGLV